MFRIKYQHLQFDGIICADNNALNFLEQYGRGLFPGVSVIATGINGGGSVNDSLITDSILAEEAEHGKTLGQALRLRPKASNCYVVSDSSTTGKLLETEVRQVIPSLETGVQFHFVDTLSYDTVKRFAESVEADDFIYLLPFFMGAKGRVFDQGQVAADLATHARAPVFVSWDLQLNTGVLGGAVLSGEKYGELAANFVLAKIAGRDVPRMIRHNEDLTLSLYDWECA